MKSNYILGISGFYHDSAAALLKDGKIIAAASEERFTRVKNDLAFPQKSIEFCLDFAQISINEVDTFVFYEKPFLKFERILETFYVVSPRGLLTFLKSMPIWLKEKLFLKKLIKDELIQLGFDDKKAFPLLFSDHHLSHAASAFFPSPFKSAAILTIDGVGEWSTSTIAIGKDNTIKTLKQMSFPHSVGLLYSAFTYFLGFKVNSGEYKLMGLAPYGNPKSKKVEEFKKIIKDRLVKINEDGSIQLDQEYFSYGTTDRMVYDDKWQFLFGFPRRSEEERFKQHHCDLALAIQQVTEEIVIKMAQHAKDITKQKNLCLAGGVALNCVANSKILKSKIFDDIWIQPAAGDAGGSLGAAYVAHHIFGNKKREIAQKGDQMQGSYLGPEFGDLDIEKVIRKHEAKASYFRDFDELAQKCAKILSDGNVIGWFQGRMEWGPRALGNRSILADARNKDMQKKLNLKIKYREGFRPFAPSVLAEDAKQYFEIQQPSPYMLLVADVVKRRKDLPQNYHELSVTEKLYFQRSDIPSVTHLDYSARLQTVHKNTNLRYWTLINKFKDLTGYSVIVNTSFNVRGEPIVCTPEEAFLCFMKTEMDYLVLGNYLFAKQSQSTYNNKYKIETRKGLD